MVNIGSHQDNTSGQTRHQANDSVPWISKHQKRHFHVLVIIRPDGFDHALERRISGSNPVRLPTTRSRKVSSLEPVDTQRCGCGCGATSQWRPPKESTRSKQYLEKTLKIEG